MLLHSQRAEQLLVPSPDDDLGQLIRWSLRRRFRMAEPPEECWDQILRRVSSQCNQKRSHEGTGTAPCVFAPVPQAAVISLLLLSFALGVNQQTVLPRQERELGVVRVSARSAGVQEYPEDNLRRYTLLRQEKAELRTSARSIPEFAELR